MSTKLASDDATLSAKFSVLRSFRGVASLLEVSPQVLGFYLHRAANYKVFPIRKRNGGERIISSPISPLKIIQRKLNQVLHAVYKGRSPVHGFVRDKSIVSNAKRHLNRDFVLNFDLADFFPSIHFGRIKGMFEAKPYSLPENVAVVLAQICSHQGHLPAGAPTSPLVANMVCAQMDSQLKQLAVSGGCTYTRYADDITFSVKHGRFPPNIAYHDPSLGKWLIGQELAAIISKAGFKINESKTRVRAKGRRQEVTGLIVGARVNVKRKYVRQVRAMLHAAERWGHERAAAEFHSKYDRKQRQNEPDFLRVLRGKIEFVGSVRGRDDPIYLSLIGRYLRLDSTARVRPVEVGPEASLEVLQRAIWLLEETNGGTQGSGFAASGLGILTAAHVLNGPTEASCPSLRINSTGLTVVRREDHVDVARTSISNRLPVTLKIGDSTGLQTGDEIKLLGFPLHRAGGSVQHHLGRITGSSVWHNVPHYLIDCPIVKGNSGGPVLNNHNEVIGIAVKGQGIPKRFEDDDEMSRFVPIHFALRYLTDP